MSTVDEIQKLCEHYISKKFGKRDKAALLEFLRGLQGQQPGDSDEEEEREAPKYSPPPKVTKVEAEPTEAPSLIGVKEGTMLHKKASQYTQTVLTKTQSERPQQVKVSDIEDVQGVKERKAHWSEVGSPEKINYKKSDAGELGYKVSDAEDVRRRREEWEQGKVSGNEVKKTKAEDAGYKVSDADDVKNRRNLWEQGKVVSSDIKKAPAEDLGYKVPDADDVKNRRNMWEQGKVSSGDFKKVNAEDRGYKVSEAPADDIKRRKAEWEAGKVGTQDYKKAAAEELGYKVSDAEDIRKRREEWEQGKVTTSANKKTDAEEAGYKVEGSSIKDKLNQWSEAEKAPTDSSGERKAPIDLPQKQPSFEDQTDVITVSIDVDANDDEHHDE